MVEDLLIYQMTCSILVIHMVEAFQIYQMTCSILVIHMVVAFQTSLRTCLVGVIHVVVDVNLDDVLLLGVKKYSNQNFINTILRLIQHCQSYLYIVKWEEEVASSKEEDQIASADFDMMNTTWDISEVAKCQHLCEKLVVAFQIYWMLCSVRVIHMVEDLQIYQMTCSILVIHMVEDFQTYQMTCSILVIHMVAAFQIYQMTCSILVIHMVEAFQSY
ncbi:hypothetical protein IWQ62_001456 [Dispira parvispora]|uniref:Uncharacterized protein n=1 Tax=Dispira parvispora TaxID=1520584 RepID=A0A9W8E4X4_9FUNG|nr:hypothetical protein IWQ62_001456 [Dispira parvispora]